MSISPPNDDGAPGIWTARSLTGQVALVTGAGRGIGFAVATRLAGAGARVVLADLDPAVQASAEALRSQGAEAWPVSVDVADATAVGRMMEAVLAREGQLDVAVHSAGIGLERRFLDTSPEEWRRILDVNLNGTFYVAQAVARAMISRAYGRIVLLASAAGLRGGTGRAAYGASKGAVIALARVMAVELAELGVTVNALAPGAIETELVARMHDAETRRAYLAGIPMRRYGTVEEVAAAALFLASTEAAYVTGEVLAVDGGFLGAGVIKQANPGGA